MSPMLDEMLVNQVVPRLRHAAPSIPKTGCEDDEEIFQDATLMAARMMDSAEKAGKSFTPGNMAWFAAKAARSGRRSHYTGRSDVMSPGCQLDGRAVHEALDAEIAVDEEFGHMALHDVIAPFGANAHEADPAEEAARNLDWELYLSSRPDSHRIAIRVLVDGGTMREAGKLCGIGDSGACALRKRIAMDLIGFFGEDVIRRLLQGAGPLWMSELRGGREKHLGLTGMQRRNTSAANSLFSATATA